MSTWVGLGLELGVKLINMGCDGNTMFSKAIE